MTITAVKYNKSQFYLKNLFTIASKQRNYLYTRQYNINTFIFCKPWQI